MKRTALHACVLVYAFVQLLPLAQEARVAQANSVVSHTVVAASGSQAPAGGNYLSLSFLNARLNARHEVAFDAFVGGPPFTTGVFVGDGRTTSTIALGANPDPAAPSFGAVFNPFITSNGDVVFQANSSDIFASHGTTIIPLVRNGDQAPGGGIVTPTAAFAVNDHGVLVYRAHISGSTATQGIFSTDATQTVAIVRDDNEVPTGGRFTSLFGDPVINDRGQVAFFAEMSDGPADFGIFRGEGSGLTPVFVANQIAPGGATFEDFGSPVINSHGEVAALASLTNGASAGLFVGDGTDAVAIALQGQPAPKGGNYRAQNTFPGAIRLNDRGDVAFAARLAGGANSSGIFRGNGDRTTTIALAGTPAPGTSGMFESFDDIKLGIDGRVAFVATLAVGVGGVDASNNRGIWIGASDDDLQLVVRTGQVIGGNVLTRLPQFGQGNQFDMNQNGLLWVGSFGSAKAIVFSRILGRNNVVDER